MRAPRFACSEVVVALSLLGCGSGSDATSPGGPAGAIGGSLNTGGNSSTSVPSSQGGAIGGSTGNSVPGTGGQSSPVGTGGNLASGGVATVGGAKTTGGAASNVGGVPSTGGIAQAAGGIALGGATQTTGGAHPVGGTVATGGTPAIGGTKSTGGGSTTGGSKAVGGGSVIGGTTSGGTQAGGGSKPTGGTASNGGATATGGASSTGGAAPASGTPKLVNTIDLKGVSGCPGLRLGDINGDGKLEIVMGQPVDQSTLDAYTPQRVTCITAFDLKGNQLWQYGTPGNFHTASSDVPIQVYDMDGDGKAEVFANMSTTQMTVLDGTTGKLLRTIPLPATGANDGIAFANLRGKPWPQDILVKTRYSQSWAITGIDDATTKAGTLLWTHKMLPSATGYSDLGTGHYPLVYDWDGDGIDEVMCGYDYLESDGTKQWSLNTTSNPPLTLHADAIATADIDADPSNGNEIVVCGNVAAAFNWKTGKQLWQDNHTTEAQQLGIGEYRTDLPGLEVVLLDRLRTAAEGYKSNNVLVDHNDNLLWKENRPDNSGWLTVTENMNNWDGKGSDLIFSYRRGSGGAYLYDGYEKTVASFPYPGPDAQNFAAHADVCGDGKEEVLVYDEHTLWIYANDGCDLNAPAAQPSLPQQYHLYNWSVYTGWINPDPKFYTPGSKQ